MVNKITKIIVLVLVSIMLPSITMAAPGETTIKLGWVTDIHHDSEVTTPNLGNLSDAIELIETFGADVLLVGGDLTSAIDLPGEPGTGDGVTSFSEVTTELNTFSGSQVVPSLGNHDFLDVSLSGAVTAMNSYSWLESSQVYGSVDYENIHFIVLDAQYWTFNPYDHYDTLNTDLEYMNDDGPIIIAAQLSWLATDLSTTDLPVVVVLHGDLTDDPSLNDDYDVMDNRQAVLDAIELNDNVIAIFSGHTHSTIHALSAANSIPIFDLPSIEDDGLTYATISFDTVERTVDVVSYTGGTLDDSWVPSWPSDTFTATIVSQADNHSVTITTPTWATDSYYKIDGGNYTLYTEAVTPPSAGIFYFYSTNGSYNEGEHSLQLGIKSRDLGGVIVVSKDLAGKTVHSYRISN